MEGGFKDEYHLRAASSQRSINRYRPQQLVTNNLAAVYNSFLEVGQRLMKKTLRQLLFRLKISTSV